MGAIIEYKGNTIQSLGIGEFKRGGASPLVREGVYQQRPCNPLATLLHLV